MCLSTSSLNVLDPIYRLKLSAIVVGQSSLGGINHALLTLHGSLPARDSHRGVGLEISIDQLHTKTARAQERVAP